MTKGDSPVSAAEIGKRIRALRQERRMSLAELAAATGVSEATLSRIETGLSAVSAPHLYALAHELGADVSDFFAQTGQAPRPVGEGTRSVTRAGEGQAFRSARFDARLLCASASGKTMHPFVNRVSARTLEAAGGLSGHSGEEYLYVLSGAMIFCAERQSPLRLETGDSLYFDAHVPHAYLAASETPAEFLVVSTINPKFAPKGPLDE